MGGDSVAGHVRRARRRQRHRGRERRQASRRGHLRRRRLLGALRADPRREPRDPDVGPGRGNSSPLRATPKVGTGRDDHARCVSLARLRLRTALKSCDTEVRTQFSGAALKPGGGAPALAIDGREGGRRRRAGGPVPRHRDRCRRAGVPVRRSAARPSGRRGAGGARPGWPGPRDAGTGRRPRGHGRASRGVAGADGAGDRQGSGMARAAVRRGRLRPLHGDVGGERPFFGPPRGDGGRGAGEPGQAVPLARVFHALVRDGHGTGRVDLAERLTWRQIELFWRVRGTEE